MLDAVLRQDGLIGDDVGWWSWFEKCGNSINNFDIGLCNTLDLIGAKY